MDASLKIRKKALKYTVTCDSTYIEVSLYLATHNIHLPNPETPVSLLLIDFLHHRQTNYFDKKDGFYLSPWYSPRLGIWPWFWTQFCSWLCL